MLFGARGDDDQVGSRGDRDVIASVDSARRCELSAVVEIENFGPDLCAVGVVEGERVGRSAYQARIRNCGADASRTDNGHFSSG